MAGKLQISLFCAPQPMNAEIPCAAPIGGSVRVPQDGTDHTM
jgi:hypothetical protein